VLALLATLLPVLGVVETTQETFSGSLAGEELVIRSASGPICRGEVRFGALGYGRGTLRCSDGRSGQFTIRLAGGNGTAVGSLEGKDLTLTIG
jgi:hypothetical protein